MKFAHCFWTKPMVDFNRWNIKNQLEKDVWLFTLSAYYINNLGYEIDLYTDDLGKQFLGKVPYYKNIYTILNDLDIPKEFWAAGKIMTQEILPLGDILIDGDIFFNDSNIKKYLNYGDYDILTEDVEDIKKFKGMYLNELDVLKEYCNIKSLDESVNIYSCGVVGFNNQKLKDTYITCYKRIIEDFKSFNVKKIPTDFIPDLISEQYLLGVILQDYKAKTLPKNMFSHLKGKIKYEHDTLNQIKNTIINVKKYESNN